MSWWFVMGYEVEPIDQSVLGRRVYQIRCGILVVFPACVAALKVCRRHYKERCPQLRSVMFVAEERLVALRWDL